MNKSAHVALMNRYPGGRVHSTDNSTDAYCESGLHRVALRKDGNGDWKDFSKELGCADVFSLSPIPKEARYMKLHKDGSIGRAEEHDERKPLAQELAKFNGGRVPSIEEAEGIEEDVAAIKARIAAANKPEPVPAQAE